MNAKKANNTNEKVRKLQRKGLISSDFIIGERQAKRQKAMQKMRDNIKGVFASRSMLLIDVQTMIETLNPKIRRMKNYYALKNAGKQLNKMDWYIVKKFTLLYNHKIQNKRRCAHISKVRRIIYRSGLRQFAA